MRKLLILIGIISSAVARAQCPIVVADAVSMCPGGPSQTVTIDISEDVSSCFNNGQNSYSETFIIDFSAPGFEFLPGTEVLNSGTGDINDGGFPFISSINANQIIIDGLGTNNGGGGQNALDQIILTVDVQSTAIGTAFIRRNGGSFLINGGAEPFGTLALANLTSSQMTYNSTSLTQNTSAVSQNTTNAQVIGFEVDVSNSGCPFTMESVDLQYTGTSLADISNAKVYYSGTNGTFNAGADALFGSITSPPAAFTITGSQELLNGTNYFWVVVDVPFTATATNQIDLDLIQYEYDDNGIPSTRLGGVDFPVGSAGSRTVTAFGGNVITVGTLARNFTTIQAAYNSVPPNLASNFIIEIYSDYNDTFETFPVTFNQKTAYNGNIILIRPALGESNIRVGGNPAASVPLFDFIGADFVTIDGRPGSIGPSRELRFVNFNNSPSAYSVFSFRNGATHNKLDYLNIEGEAETSLTGLIDFELSGGGTGNNNNTISNNIISDITIGGSVKTPGVGIYSLGTGGIPNEGNTIEANEFVDIWDGSNFDSWCIQLSTGTNNWNLTGNHFYQTAAYAACDFNSGFIQVDDGGSYDIVGNFFGGQLPNAAGPNKFTIGSGAAPFDCIYFLSGANGLPNKIAGNLINNLDITNETALGFPALTFIYNEGSSDFTIGTGDAPNIFGDQSSNDAIKLINNTTGGSTGLNGITQEGTGLMSLNHNSFGGIRVEGSVGITTILVENLFGSMEVDNCTFGGNVPNSIDVDTDARLELVSNVSTSGISIRNSTFRNVLHSAATEPFYPIYSNDGLLVVDGNDFLNLTSLSNVECRIISNIGNGSTIVNNTIESITIPSAGNASALAAIYVNSAFDADISDNIIGATSVNNISLNGNDLSYGIYKSGSGHLTCERNMIQQVEMTNGAANTRFYGIYNTGGDLTASENETIDCSVSSTSSLTALYGIYCSASTRTHNISDNVIEALSVDNGTVPISTSIEGIFISGASSTCERNTIRFLNNSGAIGSAEIIGIHNSFGPSVIKNNVVVFDNSGTTNSVGIIGILDGDGSGTVRVVHNTIVIGGNAVGTSQSSCYKRDADGNDLVSNNVFQNNRVGGTGPHYAIESPSIGGAFTSDFNFLENIDNSMMFHWAGSDEDLPTFQGTSLTNTNSIVGVETIDSDGRTTSGFIMADGGIDLFTPAIVTLDKDLNPRDVNPWPGAFEGASMVVLGPNYYVNDGLTAADEYCIASGTDGVGCGTTTNPCATIQYVQDNYLLNGDTIFVDDGVYNETDITISQPLVIHGATTSPLFSGGGVLDNIRAFDITVSDVALYRIRINGYQTYNKAIATDRNGAAIRIRDIAGTTTLSNLLIDQCFAEMGGGISIEQNIPGVNEVIISGSTLSLDSALTSGGAISANLSVNGGIDLEIVGSNIGNTGFRNGAQQNGGGIYFNGSNLKISNTLLTENNAFGSTTVNGGGAIYIENGNVTIDSCFLLVNSAEMGGAIFVDGGALDMDSTTLNGNSANGDGGAIFVDNIATLTIDRSNFGSVAFPNDATDGGAIYFNGSILDVNDTDFNNNTASNEGGGIFAANGTTGNYNQLNFSQNSAVDGGALYCGTTTRAVIDNNIFTLNSASDDGGAIYASGSSDIFILNLSEIGQLAGLGNSAGDRGGAIYFSGDTLSIDTSYIQGNSITGPGTFNDGGALYVAGKTIIERSIINGNTATDDGGGIYANAGRLWILNGSRVESNNADEGGGINFQGDSLFIEDSWLSSNGAIGNGGGINTRNSITYLSRSYVTNNMNSNGGAGIYGATGSKMFIADSSHIGESGVGNITTDQGGGIYWNSTDSLLINQSFIEYNESSNNGRAGGGLWARLGYVELTKCHVSNNAATGVGADGGGMVVENTGELFCYQSEVYSNSSVDDGAAIYNDGAILSLENCLVHNNVSTSGEGAIFDNAGSLSIMNTTVANNTSSLVSGGISAQLGSSGSVTNSIMFGNTPVDINTIVGITTSNSLYGTGVPGITVSSIIGDPLFTNAAIFDFTIMPTSPAIDLGTLAGAPTIDIVDTIRPQGLGVDAGAFEHSSISCDTALVGSVHTWLGTTSSDWFDCTNWDTGSLPNSSSTVIIPGATLFNPLITGQTGYCGAIQINVPAGALLTLDTTGLGRLEIGP